jgi:hypothetical protein
VTNKLVSCKERRRLAPALDAIKKKARILFTITTQFKVDYPRDNSWAIEQEKPYHKKKNGEYPLTHGMVARDSFKLSVQTFSKYYRFVGKSWQNSNQNS